MSANNNIISAIIYKDDKNILGDTLSIFDKGVFTERMARFNSNVNQYWSIEPSKTGKPQMIYNRTITSLVNLKPMALISIVINPEFLKNTLINLDIGEGTHLFVLDEMNRIVADNSKDANFSMEFKDANLAKVVKKSLEENKYSLNYTLDKSDKLLVFAPIQNTSWTLYASIPYEVLIHEPNAIRNLILLVALITLIVAILLSLTITNSIAVPMRKLINVMHEAKNGNLTVQLESGYNDEIGRVMQSFMDMVGNINMLVKQVDNSSRSVVDKSYYIASVSERSHKSSEQVSQTIEEITKGAIQQAHDVSEGVSQLQTLEENISHVDTGLHTMTEVVHDTRALSDVAFEAINGLSKSAMESSDASNRVVDDINKLSVSMREIEKITKVIVGIADKTNLLALNAAIEAARAGEAGLGFAVVSDEVRLLAEQSRRESEQIRGIVNDICNKTELTVYEAGKNSMVIQNQLKAVQVTTKSFEKIHSAMDKMTQQINLINNAIDEVVVSKNNVKDTFGSVSAVSEETATTTQEVAASTQVQIAEAEMLSGTALELKMMSQQLKESLSKFSV